MKPKKRECEVNRIGLKALGLGRCDVNNLKREAALIERDAELVKRETVVPTAMEKVNENEASMGGMPEHVSAILIALAFLLEVTNSTLAKIVVFEAEARTAHDQIRSSVKNAKEASKRC